MTRYQHVKKARQNLLFVQLLNLTYYIDYKVGSRPSK